MADDRSSITAPTHATRSSVRFFTMPEMYRHGAVTEVREPSLAPLSKTAPTVPPPVPAPVVQTIPAAAPIPVLPKQTESSHVKRGVLIAGGLIVVALGIGGYMLIRSAQQAEESARRAQKVAEDQAAQQAAKLAEAQKAAEQAAQNAAQQSSNTQPISSNPSDVGTSNPFPTTVLPGVDTDSDGLTDAEEQSIYGTNTLLPDTDADGFLDGNEVFHGYNPNGLAPAALLEAGLTQAAQGNGFIFQVPVAWTVAVETPETTTVQVATGERIRLVKLAKDPAIGLAVWYEQQIKDGVPTLSKTKKGFPMIMSKNQLTAHVDMGAMVLTISYDTGASAAIEYLTTFQWLLNSLDLNR